MLCIFKLHRRAADTPEAIAGWILAKDVADARMQAFVTGECLLASHLGPHFNLTPGKHYLCHAMNGDECWVLAG